MERFDRTLLALLPMVLFAASCGTMRSTTTSVDDDVYFMPSTAPVLASTDRGAPVETPAVEQPVTDDYFSEDASRSLSTNGGYYDMAYNDPYYYNYGRFGFNTGPMGWQTGWNGPGWGGGMGWGGGWNSGWGNGWNTGWNVGLGWGWGYGGGIYSGWWRPNWAYDPWGWNNWGYGWGGGYGYGNYYGPWGSCYSCYTPVVIGDGGWGSTVVAPRRPLGAGNTGTAYGTRRVPVRNPVGLAPAPTNRAAMTRNRGTAVDRSVNEPTKPVRTRPASPTRTRDESQPTRDVGRTAPSRGFDGGGGGRSSPSPGTGGGGGGTRTSPGRR